MVTGPASWVCFDDDVGGVRGVGMELGLGGKVAVVTGASKGIGLAVTRRFVEEGARVIAGARTISPELAELVDGGAASRPNRSPKSSRRER